MRFDSAGADRITAAVFFALGAAMTWGGYVMDRLEIRNIHPASIPGLVPMMLGVALMICAGLLYLGAKDAHAEDGPTPDHAWSDFAISAGWSVFYALVLVGNMPFVVASAIYLLGFTGYFLWHDHKSKGFWKTALFVAVFSVTTAAAVSALFRYGFLVRLP